MSLSNTNMRSLATYLLCQKEIHREILPQNPRPSSEWCIMDYYLGRRHDINLQRDSLRIRLHENNTVDISARLDVAVHARTWIWKGVNFGFLGCMKITSCGGQTVTYRGKIDMKMSFQVVWNEEKQRLEVTIRPVDTQLFDVHVAGCRPPWYLW